MKRRKWVLFVFMFLIAVVLTLFYGWREFGANERLKKYILEKTRPILGDEIDISQVHVGFGNVHLLGVHLPLRDERIDVEIEDLVVGYNFINLILPKYKTTELANNIQFIKPKITVTLMDSVLTDSGQQNGTHYPGLIEWLKPSSGRLSILNRVSISNGDLFLSVSDSEKVHVVHSIDGAIYTEKPGTLGLKWTGHLLDSKQQTVVAEGQYDLRAGLLSSGEIHLRSYQLGKDFFFVPENKFQFTSGWLNGRIRMTTSGTGPYTTNTTGKFTIRDAAGIGLGDKLQIDDINMRARIDGRDIHIDSSSQKVNGSMFTVSGVVSNIKQPVVDLEAASQNCELLNFNNLLPDKMQGKVAGVARATSHIKGSLSNPSVQIRLTSPILSLFEQSFSNYELDFLYNNSGFEIRNNTAVWQNQNITLKGEIDSRANESKLSGTIDAKGDMAHVLNKIATDSVHACSTVLSADISGTFNDPLVIGTLNADLKTMESDIFLNSAFSVYNQKIRLTGLRNPRTRLSGYIDFSSAVPAVQINWQNLDDVVYALWNVPYEERLKKMLQISSHIRGNLQDFETQIEFMQRQKDKSTAKIVDVTSRINRTKNGLMNGTGEILFHPGTGYQSQGGFEFQKQKDGFILKHLNIADALITTFKMTKTDTSDQIQGDISFSRFDIMNLLAPTDTLFSGYLNGQLQIGGHLSEPLIAGSTELTDAYYKKRGPYSSQINFDYKKSEFSLNEFLLNLQESTLLLANGSSDRNFDALDFTLKGAGFNIKNILGVTGENKPLMTGETLVDVNIKGDKEAPEINGVIALKEGDVAGIPFDELEIQVGDSGLAESGQSPRLYIQDFRLTRYDEYELTGNGFYPLLQKDSLALDVQGVGNYLLILSDWQQFFINPKSSSRFSLQVSGTPHNPEFDAVKLEINEASMSFKKVVAPISDVSALLTFEPDENFFKLHYLKGNMGENPFHIYNQQADEILSDRPLDNINIPGSEVHAGVFIFETPGDYIPLNIVGLMEPGNFGMLKLLGRNPDEKMYLAKDGGQFTLRGKIKVSHAEIMYPFYEGGFNKKTAFHHFLENLDWDLLVVPMENTWYTRNFPGAIDEVHVNIMLDKRFGGLDMSGTLEDESFRINGELRSTNGFIEYLDMNFRVEQFGVQFDRSSLTPMTYGRARTTVTDSVGISSNIYLSLQTKDEIREVQEESSVGDFAIKETERARFDDIRFKLSSDNPNLGNNDAQILASLGYSANDLQGSALSAIGYSTDNILFRPIFRPVERKLEQAFGFDYVRFSSQLTKNIITFNLNNNIALNNRLALLESTRLIVGKYLADQFFIQYTGQIESGIGYRYKAKDLGLHHTVGLEYRISPQILLELEYDYDSLMLYNRDDARIVLRHWFPF